MDVARYVTQRIFGLAPWVGGLEQGTFLPSLSWLVGVRSQNGTEFGVGPNVSPAGFSLVVASGVTFRSGALNVPINLALQCTLFGALGRVARNAAELFGGKTWMRLRREYEHPNTLGEAGWLLGAADFAALQEPDYWKNRLSE